MKPVTVPLVPTISYKHRYCVWHRYTKADNPVWGVLDIREARRDGLKEKSSRYVVRELQPAARVRRFVLHPQVTSDSETSYVLLAGPRDSGCTCKGFMSQSHCKHVTTLEVLQLRKLLPTVRSKNVKVRP